ncbi:hypothetical protein CLBEIC_45120 [Clostridium beijerinckii]|nr:hypothetical protein CLOBI_49280 [Clostridium beijerinckii]OOM66975.1 hypothetical protein CLBEIC_45120 [Clostridium beijerinckii]CUU45459.1 protein of unknown function [Clostridium beijerinckii]
MYNCIIWKVARLLAKKIGFFLNEDKCINDLYKVCSNDNNRILNNEDNEEKIIKKLIQQYKERNFDKQKLKNNKILLENNILKLERLSQINILTSLMSIAMSFIAAMLAILNGTNTVVSKAKEKSGVGAEEFVNDAKDTLNLFNNFVDIMSILVIVFIIVIGIMVIRELRAHKNNIKRKVAINIHKSVIEEQLKELEKEKLVNEKEDEIEKDIEYLKEKISEYKYKTEVFEDILKVKANEINR